MLAQEDHLLGPRQDGRPIRKAGLESVVAEQLITPGMEGADDRVGIAIGDEPIDPLGHLQRGPVGKGEGQDLRWLRPLLGDKPGDAPGDDRRLSGPGAGHDEQRPVAVGDRLSLARGQIGQERRLNAQMRTRSRPRPGDQLLEDRYLVR